MPHRVCPWWIGYWLASPLRRFSQDPAAILAPYVREGIIVLEPGPGMGFFTVELARRVGSSGQVIAVDIQPRMLTALRRRLARRGLLARVDARLAAADSLGVAELNGAVDFVLAFAMVHELPSVASFFIEIAATLKPGASMLLAEPRGHVQLSDFEAELKAAAAAGLKVTGRPSIPRSHAALLTKDR
jgi:SAM-dependent methyltransferase